MSRAGGDKVGCTVELTPQQICWFVDNTSMNGGDSAKATNAGKNDNVISINTISATAESFRPGIVSGTSTAMMLCPANTATGNPRHFAEAYCAAEAQASGERQVRRAAHCVEHSKGSPLRLKTNCLRILRLFHTGAWAPYIRCRA